MTGFIEMVVVNVAVLGISAGSAIAVGHLLLSVVLKDRRPSA
jgi:hypothetical protein